MDTSEGTGEVLDATSWVFSIAVENQRSDEGDMRATYLHRVGPSGMADVLGLGSRINLLLLNKVKY
jgi:hypothetical protein